MRKIIIDTIPTTSVTNHSSKHSVKGFIPPFPALKEQERTGFTLLEVILVIMIIAVLFVVGARYTVYAIDSKKYTRTLEKMVTIKHAIVGDERLNNLGVRPDFGYFERFAAFPAAEGGNSVPTTALAEYLPPTPDTNSYDPYKVDELNSLLEKDFI